MLIRINTDPVGEKTAELLFPEDFKKEVMRLYPQYGGEYYFIWQENRPDLDVGVAKNCIERVEFIIRPLEFSAMQVIGIYKKSPRKFKAWVEDLEDKLKLWEWFLKLKDE